MNRTKLCYCVNLAMFLALLSLASVGALLGLGIGRGPHWAAHTRHPWGMSRHGWSDLHALLGLVFLALLAVHIALHWSWIIGTTRGLIAAKAVDPPQTGRGHNT